MRKNLHSKFFALAALFLIGTVPQAQAQAPSGAGAPDRAGAAFTMGEVGRRAPYGQDGSWRTSASGDGALVLTGQGESPGWTADIVQPPALPYTIQVELTSTIAPAEGRAVGAGVVFGFNRQDGAKGRTFYAALVTGSTLTVYRYDGTFYQVSRSSGSGRAPQSGRSTLRITVKADSYAVSLNDNGSVTQDAEGALTGEYGVMASGAGEAIFRNLVIRGATQ